MFEFDNYFNNQYDEEVNYDVYTCFGSCGSFDSNLAEKIRSNLNELQTMRANGMISRSVWKQISILVSIINYIEHRHQSFEEDNASLRSEIYTLQSKIEDIESRMLEFSIDCSLRS